MQKWQKKIFDGMAMIKEGCAAAPSSDCKKCPFLKYCYAENSSDAPMSWQVVEPPEPKKYEVTLEYKVIVDNALTERLAIDKAISELSNHELSTLNKTAVKSLTK